MRIRKIEKILFREEKLTTSLLKPQINWFKEKFLANPKLLFQIGIIIFVVICETTKMERQMDNFSSTVDKIKDVTEIMNHTMRSVKIAADAPEKIRQVLE